MEPRGSGATSLNTRGPHGSIDRAVYVQVRKNAAHDGRHFGQDAKPGRTVLKRKAPAAPQAPTNGLPVEAEADL